MDDGEAFRNSLGYLCGCLAIAIEAEREWKRLVSRVKSSVKKKLLKCNPVAVPFVIIEKIVEDGRDGLRYYAAKRGETTDKYEGKDGVVAIVTR